MTQYLSTTSEDTAPEERPPWRALDVERVADLLRVDLARGLDVDDAACRLDARGPNVLAMEEPRSNVDILLVAFVVTVAIAKYTDAAVIAAVLAIDATIGYLQEREADRSVQAVTPAGWARIGAAVIAVIAISEAHKWLRSRRGHGS